MNAKLIGERIKEYRKLNNLSQRELAEQLFVSDKTISRWELGNGLPDIELLPKIAEILGISIDKLVGAENLSGENDELEALDLYREELKKREALLIEKEEKVKLDTVNRNKLKRIYVAAAAALFIVALSFVLFFTLNKPKYILSLVGATAEGYEDGVYLREGDGLPEIITNGKTLLGFIDEDNNYYSLDGFRMPAKDTTLRALIKEEMPLFTGSDRGTGGTVTGEHVFTEEGIPATKYVFAEGSKKGTSLQSRPVEDSGSVQGINTYVPSLGSRFLLLRVENTSDVDLSIKYRVENFSNQQGGLDYYTPTYTVKAESVAYIPVYFECSGSFGVFEGCDHFVILDQDVQTEVSLIIYGYIYTADELTDIEVEKAPDKQSYTEGERVDLSGMVVKGSLANGSTTGKVTICNYTCNLNGASWVEGMNGATVEFAGRTAEVTINVELNYDKIAFAPAANIQSINDTNGADYISAEYTTVNGLPATTFTFKAGATSGMEVEAWINQVIEDAMNGGYNLRIPTFSGRSRRLEITVTNRGSQPVSFRYYAESWGDKGGVDVSLSAGESKTVEFEVDPGHSIGCNYALKLLSDLSEETSVTMQGYFYCDSESELDGIKIYKEAERLSFRVGEAFSSRGLVIGAVGAAGASEDMYREVVISNYLTDIEEGFVFTRADIGSKTVEVSFGDLTVSYEIEITE